MRKPTRGVVGREGGVGSPYPVKSLAGESRTGCIRTQHCNMMQQSTSRAAYFRAWRSKRKVAKQTERAKVLPSACKWPENPGLAIAQWSREKLIVPAGHPRGPANH